MLGTAVPVATIHEHRDLGAGEGDVDAAAGCTGDRVHHAEPESAAVQLFPYGQLWRSVPSRGVRHALRDRSGRRTGVGRDGELGQRVTPWDGRFLIVGLDWYNPPMGSLSVDQIDATGRVIQAPDVTLSPTKKLELLLAALPGATRERFAGVDAVRFEEHVLLLKQVTHLGNPWPGFKKRIQIPHQWLAAEAAAREAGLSVAFLGIYHHGPVTIFVDFDPATYVQRAANNSAAHVATNDLFQAQLDGVFSREDRNGNRLTSVRSDVLLDYLTGGVDGRDPRLDVFRGFNTELFDGHRVEAVDAVRAMHDAGWPDRFQSEWPGFFLEYRFDRFVRDQGLGHLTRFQKVKRRGELDYDLVFANAGQVDFYGDLKASDLSAGESPGNDMADLLACLELHGRFWYVVYEHETWHARDNGDEGTVAWNRLRRDLGHRPAKPYDDLSYARRFKEAVRWEQMLILEVNPANVDVVLGDFNQGRQPDGSARAIKCMIRKRNIDNFLIMRETRPR